MKYVLKKSYNKMHRTGLKKRLRKKFAGAYLTRFNIMESVYIYKRVTCATCRALYLLKLVDYDSLLYCKVLADTRLKKYTSDYSVYFKNIDTGFTIRISDHPHWNQEYRKPNMDIVIDNDTNRIKYINYSN